MNYLAQLLQSIIFINTFCLLSQVKRDYVNAPLQTPNYQLVDFSSDNSFQTAKAFQF